MASEFLPFWPKGALIGWAGPSLSPVFKTDIFETGDFTEVVAELMVEVDFGSNRTIDVTPEISNDGKNWESITGFTQVAGGAGTFPITEVLKIDKVAKWMRFKILFGKTSGDGYHGATLSILANGRN